MKTYSVTKQELYTVEVPQSTLSYKPVSHRDIVENILETVANSGMHLHNEVYKSAQEGRQARGEFRFISNDDSEIGMSMVWQNSYNKSLSLKLAAGYHVFVCGNGACYGDIGSFKKKHVGEIQSLTPSIIKNQLQLMETEFERAIKFKKRAKEIELTKKTCSELLGRMFYEEECINVTQLSIIKREMANPQYDYGVSNTLWNLANNISHSAKEVHPALYLSNSIKVANFLETEFA